MVDGTGFGRLVMILLRAAKLGPVPVLIHDGDQVTHDKGWQVPKRDLVDAAPG